MTQTCQSISEEIETYPYGELYYTHTPGFIFSLSELEKRMTGGLMYIDEIDKLYYQIIHSIKRNIDKYNSLELYRICSGLQRCSIYDEELLKLILNEVCKKDFFGFSDEDLTLTLQKIDHSMNDLQKKLDNTSKSEKESKLYRETLIEYKKILRLKADTTKKIRETMNNLNSFSGIVHCFAVFNYQDAKFTNFINEIIELYYLKFLNEGTQYLEFLEMYNIPKLIWSLCVIGSPFQIKKSVRYLSNILLKSNYKEKLNLIDISQMYYSTIYLADTGVYDQSTSESMKNTFYELNMDVLKIISMIHLDICKYIEKLEVAHSIEEKIELIPIDVIIAKKTRDNKKLVIDFHGYSHFFRNSEDLKGNAVFKRKIFENLNIEYMEITIFDWLLLEDIQKLEYMRARLDKYIDL